MSNPTPESSYARGTPFDPLRSESSFTPSGGGAANIGARYTAHLPSTSLSVKLDGMTAAVQAQQSEPQANPLHLSREPRMAYHQGWTDRGDRIKADPSRFPKSWRDSLRARHAAGEFLDFDRELVRLLNAADALDARVAELEAVHAAAVLHHAAGDCSLDACHVCMTMKEYDDA